MQVAPRIVTRWAVLGVALAVASLFPGTPARAAIELAREGRSARVIVVADDAPAPEQAAARELQEHLKLVTGAELPVMTESALAGGDAPRILIGRTKATSQLLPDVKWDELGHDGIVLKAKGDTLILAGGRLSRSSASPTPRCGRS